MSDKHYLSEVFRIVEGALRLDGEKVRNYVNLLAEKLEADGNTSSSKRLRQMLNQQGNQLRPASFRQQHNSTPPVDDESRFPLLQQVPPQEQVDYLYSNDAQRKTVEDFLAVARARTQLESQGVSANTSLLLYGPPGCGKTHLASYIAKQLDLPLFLARLDGLISSFLGSTAKNIRAVLEFASRTPCVLFLDEFDAIAKLRDDQQELGELKRVVNSFLQNLDVLGREVLLIAATNHEQLLDTAVWRRFHFQLYIDFPNLAQREHFWRTFSAGDVWSPKHLKVLADISTGYSVAAIETASARLRQRSIIHGGKPTLREAIEALLPLGRGQAVSMPVLQPEWLTDLTLLTQNLSERDPQLYSLTVIGEIAGLSKATMSRRAAETGNKSKPRVKQVVVKPRLRKKVRGAHGR
jgi:DNA replication protein DnaC